MTNRVRVLESVKAPGPVVKYIDQVVRYAPDDIDFSYFSWRQALFGEFDVLHVHFPEGMVRSASPLKRALKHVLFRAFLLRLRLKGIPIVRTVHNVEPHDQGRSAERRLLQRLDRLVSHRVVLNECTTVYWDGPTTLIPHGHYREQMAAFPRRERIEGRLLLFGRLRPYKGALELIRALDREEAEGLELRIVGSPTPGLQKEIEAEISKPGRRGAKISVDLRTVSDEEMVAEMSAAELVVIPNQDLAQSNSGVALMALSLDRPVLIQRVCMTESLARETGPGWVHFIGDELSVTGIKRALEDHQEQRSQEAPTLSGRDWESVAVAYARILSDVAAAHRAS